MSILFRRALHKQPDCEFSPGYSKHIHVYIDVLIIYIRIHQYVKSEHIYIYTYDIYIFICQVKRSVLSLTLQALALPQLGQTAATKQITGDEHKRLIILRQHPRRCRAAAGKILKYCPYPSRHSRRYTPATPAPASTTSVSLTQCFLGKSCDR